MVTNGPRSETILTLQARKSFALGLFITDSKGVPMDITGTSYSIVMRNPRIPAGTVDDSGNLITNAYAEIVDASIGFARFVLQATDLDHDPDEYSFTITMWSQGYSTVIAKGLIVLEQNDEWGSVGETYDIDDLTSSAITAALRDQTVLSVKVGPTLVPGAATFTQEMYNRILTIYAAAAAGVDIGLLTLDDIPDGSEYVRMTPAEKAIIANLTMEWDDINNKPDFGDIITYDITDVLVPGGVAGSDITSGEVDPDYLPIMSGHRGFTVAEVAPTGGNPGDLYLWLS